MKLPYTLLTTTAIALVSTAYGQVISGNVIDEIVITTTSADKEVTITPSGSLTNIDPNDETPFLSNVIFIEAGTSGAVVQNDGIINVIVDHSDDPAAQYYFPTVLGNGIYDSGMSSQINNTGRINIDYTAIKTQSYTATAGGTVEPRIEVSTDTVGNGIYGHVTNNDGFININGNFIVTVEGTAAEPGTATPTSNFYIVNSSNGIYGSLQNNMGVIDSNLTTHLDLIANSINTGLIEYADQVLDSGNGIFGDIQSNNGLIRTYFDQGFNLALSEPGNDPAIGGLTSIHRSGNGIAGSLAENTGVIQAENTLSVARTGGLYAYTSAQYLNTGNGVFGNINNNMGIVAARTTSIFGAEGLMTGSSYGYHSNVGNGVYGSMDVNNGVIRGASEIISTTSGATTAEYIDYINSGNGVMGEIKANIGTISAYLNDNGTELYNRESGIGVVYMGAGPSFVPPDAVGDIPHNTGSILGHIAAVSYTSEPSGFSFDNYGVLAGQKIYGAIRHVDGATIYEDIEGTMAAANNYGTYVEIDEAGNVIAIRQGTSATDAYGRTSEQAAMVGTTDSYNIYTTETEITNKLVNGAGVASGVVTLKNTDDFTITNSSLNAYHTALELQTTHRVEATNSYFNGGGLKNVMSYRNTTALTSGNPTSEYAVIAGDNQDNFLIVRGTSAYSSFINGDVAFGDGADIFVLDIENTQLNGTADLGASDDDTFALYTFTGNQDELRATTLNYATWGIFNPYLGDKVFNFENIGTEVGTISMEDDLTDYGLYVGTQAIGDFSINNETALKNLRNDGIVTLANGTAGGHITIGDYLKGTGTYIFDTDFATLKSDYITVNGDVTANGIIAINDVTGATSTQKGKILLIEAPNDSNKSDEDFNLALANQYNDNSKQGRFTNSPYVWQLGTSGNDWVLSTLDEDKPVVAEIPAYTSLPTIGREMVMDELGTLHTRLGELRNNQGWVGTGESNLKTNLGSAWHNAIGFDDSKANAWLKGTISHFDISSDNSFDVSGTYGGFNAGIDKKFDLGNSSPDWSVFTGLFGGYKTGAFETSGKGNQYTSNEHADIDIDAWSIGAYATFFNTAGTYIDLVAEYMDLSADIDAAGLNSSTNGYALAGSIEVGHSFDLAKDWIIEPQAQIKVAHINWDNFNDGVNDVSFEDHTYVTGRAGVRIEKTIASSIGEIKPWAYIGVLHEFTDAPEATYANTIFEAVDYNTAGEIKLGITADVYKSTQMYANIGYATDFSDYNSIKGDLGLRVSW